MMPHETREAVGGESLIRPYGTGDRSALIELLRSVWPHKTAIEQHIEERWWWQHSEPPLFLAEDLETHALTGLAAALPFRLRAGRREHEAAWFVDFYVRSMHQG